MKHFYVLLFFCFATTPLFGQIDYETQIQPIFTQNCASCHSGSPDMRSYNGVIGSTNTRYGANFIIPGNGEGSGLIDKLEPSPQFGGRMPQGGALSDNQINLIRQWIDEGANATATSIEEDNNVVTEFTLNGNYPNPFNPSTQISFTAPVTSRYSIEVFSINGQRVTEQSGATSVGDNSVLLNLVNQPSGMYLYRVVLLNGDRILSSAMGRMTLIK